jgi:uncharacterized protein YuzE
MMLRYDPEADAAYVYVDGSRAAASTIQTMSAVVGSTSVALTTTPRGASSATSS